MAESKADELRRLAPWTTIECDMCGSMHQATRSGGRVVTADTLLLCAGCEGHEQGRAAGDAEGYARGADRMARAMVAALYWRAGEADLHYRTQLRDGHVSTLGLLGALQAVSAARALAEDAERCL